MYDNACVYGDAHIRDDAAVYDNARVYGNAVVCDLAQVFGNAQVYGDAWVCAGRTWVCGHAWVYGNATVRDASIVCNNAKVYGDAYVANRALICCNSHFITNTESNLVESIRAQTGLLPVDNEVIAYKQVQKDLTPFYDSDFKFEVGKVAVAEIPDRGDASHLCGLHFVNAHYWDNQEDILNSTILIAKIKLEDIIAVQEGKIRCRKAEIIGKYDIKL